VSNEPPLPPASPMTVARTGTSRRGVVPTGPTDTVVMVNGDLRTAPTWMDAVLAVQPMPPIESIVIAAAVAAESDREIAPPTGWASLRARRYGGTVVSVLVADGEPNR